MRAGKAFLYIKKRNSFSYNLAADLEGYISKKRSICNGGFTGLYSVEERQGNEMLQFVSTC